MSFISQDIISKKFEECNEFSSRNTDYFDSMVFIMYGNTKRENAWILQSLYFFPNHWVTSRPIFQSLLDGEVAHVLVTFFCLICLVIHTLFLL